MSGPERTCIVTRERHPRSELVRLVCDPTGTVVVDYGAKLPGRGVWVLPTSAALKGLPRKRKLVERTLGGTCDPVQIEANVRRAVHEAVAHGLSMAAAGGELRVGRDRSVESLMRGRAATYAWSEDCADRTRQALDDVADGVIGVQMPLTSEEVGARIGRGAVAVLTVSHGSGASYLRRQLRRLSQLG